MQGQRHAPEVLVIPFTLHVPVFENANVVDIEHVEFLTHLSAQYISSCGVGLVVHE